MTKKSHITLRNQDNGGDMSNFASRRGFFFPWGFPDFRSLNAMWDSLKYETSSEKPYR